MYLETYSKRFAVKRARYIKGIGNVGMTITGFVDQRFSLYQCDHCGYKPECLVLDGSDDVGEDFYCRECGKNVGVKPQVKSNFLFGGHEFAKFSAEEIIQQTNLESALLSEYGFDKLPKGYEWVMSGDYCVGVGYIGKDEGFDDARVLFVCDRNLDELYTVTIDQVSYIHRNWADSTKPRSYYDEH